MHLPLLKTKTQESKCIKFCSFYFFSDVISNFPLFFTEKPKTESIAKVLDSTLKFPFDFIVNLQTSVEPSLEKVPKIMSNLNSAHTELIKEQKITEGRTKGSRTFNMFEDGLNDDDE